MFRRSKVRVLLVALAMLLLAAATPAQAQREFEPLFDTFNASAQFSRVGLSIEIRKSVIYEDWPGSVMDTAFRVNLCYAFSM
jgi:hypothetical protein